MRGALWHTGHAALHTYGVRVGRRQMRTRPRCQSVPLSAGVAVAVVVVDRPALSKRAGDGGASEQPAPSILPPPPPLAPGSRTHGAAF
jgi:hypothetical protein